MAEKQRKHPRTPMSLLVQFRFDNFDDFVAEYAENLSPGGMFIRTDHPADAGTVLQLQFSLQDGSKLIEGLGRVVHVTKTNSPSQPAGMGVQFIQFDDESMELVQQLSQHAAAKKGKPASPRS